jgi:hypothetical protein
MNDRDELASIIASTFRIHPNGVAYVDHKGGSDAILAAGYRRPRTITTVEELDALRFQAVVLDAYGTPYVCERHRTDGTRNEWKPSGMDHLEDSETILYHGPAVVIHEGEPRP